MSTEFPVDLLQATLPEDVNKSQDFLGKLRERALEVVVDGPEIYTLLAQQMQRVNKLSADFQERRLSFTRPLDQLKAQWMAVFQGPKDLADDVVRVIKDKLLAYDREQDRKRLEAERVARQKALEEERARQEELRLAREEAEAQAQREREAAQAQLREAAAAGDLAKAEAAGAQLDLIAEVQAEQVQAIEAAAVAAPLPIIAEYVPEPPKVAGLSRRKVWQFEVTDKAALIAQAQTDPRIAALLEVDESALRKLVQALGAAHGVNGVRAWQGDTMAAGRK